MSKIIRIIPALILSGLVVFLFRITYYPSDVVLSFDVKISEPVTFHADVAGKNLRKAEMDKSLTQQSTHFQKVSFTFPLKEMTGLSLSFSTLKQGIEIRNIQLEGVWSVDVLKEAPHLVHVHDVDQFSNKNGALVIQSYQEKPLLLIGLEKPLTAKHHFIYPIFFSLFVLSFLLFYPLACLMVSGCLKLKSFPDKTNLTFIVIIGILLIFPASYIDFSSIVSREKRILAKSADLFVDGRINNAFGRHFDEWFKDRFSMRDVIIDAYNNLQNRINQKFERNGVIIGKNNWLFHGRTKNFTGKDKYSEAELELMKKNLQKLKEFCNKHNIKLYIMISAYKHHIYPEYYPDAVKRTSDIDRVDLIKDYLDKSGLDLNLIYLKHPLMAEKEKTKEWLYFKTDHHWTDRGAFASYQALMKMITRDFPDVKPVSEKDYILTKGKKVRAECDRTFYDGVQYSQLNLKDESAFDLDYVFYDHKDKKSLKVDDQCFPKSHFNYPKGADKKVFYITDSNGENFMTFLAHTFKHIQKRRYNAEIKPKRKNENIYMSFYEKDILDYKPDILIIGTYDGYTPSLMALYED